MSPRGGLVGMLGTGIGAVAEYREHRKQQKQQTISRESSRQEDDAPSTTLPPGPQPAARGLTHSGDALPRGGRVLATGGQTLSDEKTATRQYDEDDDDSSGDSLPTEDDSEDWELDEMLKGTQSRDLPSYEESETNYRTTDELAQDVMLASRGAIEVPRTRQTLPLPVIIPQRRPRNKARGFVRAYAPVLANSGIDQATFLSFLDNFHKSSQASPVFTVIQVSAALAGLAPSIIAMAVSTAVQVAARVGAEVQSRQRTNTFLNKMNEELFKPAGLYALIMKYKPDAEVRSQTGSVLNMMRGEKVDMSTNQIIAKYVRTLSEQSTASRDGEPSSRTMSDRMRDLRLASGKTRGSLLLPEAAPLIFPDIDAAIAKNGAEETFKDKAKDAQAFLADYLDRRAQLQYARDDPRSNLAIPEDQRAFRSKLADPDHPMYQGGILNFATGSALAPFSEKRERKAAKRFRKDERRVLKYEQKMDRGQGLSRKKERRYENFFAEQERLGNEGALSQRLGGGRRRGGGLIGGLVGAAVTAASSRGAEGSVSGGRASMSASHDRASGQQQRHREHEASYLDSHHGEHDGHQDARDANGANGTGPGYQRYSKRDRRGREPGAVKRLMREDVLYLMIVNYPSEGQMREAMEEMAMMKGR
ncbi:hypothetical protein LTR53_003113 [Teratosphaeriaceae sp. CCFEE 6253]|nr:hypothetical protein LTR53_003113 [Teratosphaeriaceae sp. CCFEE 6253]